MYSLTRTMAEAVQKQALDPATTEQELRDQLINMCELSVQSEQLLELHKKSIQNRDEHIELLQSNIEQMMEWFNETKRLVYKLPRFR